MLPEGSFPLPDPRVLEGSREFPSSDFPTCRVWMTLSVTSFLLHSLPISKQADRCPVYQLLTPTAEAEEEKDVTVISWSSPAHRHWTLSQTLQVPPKTGKMETPGTVGALNENFNEKGQLT